MTSKRILKKLTDTGAYQMRHFGAHTHREIKSHPVMNTFFSSEKFMFGRAEGCVEKITKT